LLSKYGTLRSISSTGKKRSLKKIMRSRPEGQPGLHNDFQATWLKRENLSQKKRKKRKEKEWLGNMIFK
jgi:hypothetical protein